MSHKTRVNSTNYTIFEGRTRVDGTYYHIVAGNTLVGGTNYNLLFYYGDVNNIESMVWKIDRVHLYDVTDGPDNSFKINTNSVSSYDTWINTYGEITITENTGTYTRIQVDHNRGSSLNDVGVYLDGDYYFKYKNGHYKAIDTPLLKYNLSGTIKIKVDDDTNGSADYVYWGTAGNENKASSGTRTLTYPDDFSSDANASVGIGRYSGSSSCYNKYTVYNPTINGISIPACIEIDPAITGSTGGESKITFTIDGASYTCTRGMTWTDWESTTDGRPVISFDHDDFVTTNKGYLCITGSQNPQEASDVISSGGSYTSYNITFS